MVHAMITATGSYIPTVAVPNEHFSGRRFYGENGAPLALSGTEIIKKFNEITAIRERRYATEHLNTSDMAFMAAQRALEGVDKESLDYIIVCQNLGDVRADSSACDMVPTLAARVKHKLRIRNPYTVVYDVPFGCAGWLHGMIIADHYIQAGYAKKILVIGAETPSRLSDPYDRDSMIYADGAGAALAEATDREVGILSHVTRCDTLEEVFLLRLDKSYNPQSNGNRLFIKMHGHKIYRYALKTVPETVKQSLDKAGLTLDHVKKILMHQANQKMDEAILRKLFKLYRKEAIPEFVLPMTVSWLGNSWVATLPTLFDLLQKGKLENHRLQSGDIVVFAAMGAGMNVNSMVYRLP
jgi:3-oxoacyl-[acyl-carrier-protein] synthase-3